MTVEPDKIKHIVEAAIFAADGPLDRDALLLLFDEQERPERADLSRSLEQISEDYAERGIELKEVASGFRFQVRKDLGPWVSRLWQEKPPRYSRAILETLALVAYRQPITRGEIEEIRGVSVSSHIIKSLLERSWVRVVGHRDVPGRPAMFATTRQFLDYFDLKSLEDLPPLSEIKDLDKLNEELALSDAPDPDSDDDDDSNDATAAFGARTEGEREARNEEIFAALDEEPELDDSTLMSIDKVDSVNAGFEEEFRRKPAPAEGTGEQAAKAADEDEQSPHE
ncbi:MAG TPA: SMC-Scp complex subunit ScpB [Alcanivorax sp.]|nr:SMC-Scp complex subunit ScpB [Alcanivorax sp.]